MVVGCLEYAGDGTTMQHSHELQLEEKTGNHHTENIRENNWWFKGGGRGGENMAKKNSQQIPLEETPHTVHV